MHTEHTFKKSYFSHLNRCMHCKKISVLKPVYKCTGCSIVSHQGCLERNQYAIDEHLRVEKRQVEEQKTSMKIKYNELGELLEPNYLYNMLVIEKRHPISLMSKECLKARNAGHKSLFSVIRARVLEPYASNTMEPVPRRLGQEPSATVTERELSADMFLSTQGTSAEAIELLVPAPDTDLEEQERISGSPELGEGAPEQGSGTPELESSRSPEPNASQTSEPAGAAKPELSEPVSELSVTKLE
ncbi:uncharacterized protein LOC111037946 [Myzus persicae]|uniref:uncharacterized protein LOC111037946 n=1 Tax=Myzus persicae TaxID=13164 RepID=UPI000B93372B|nr:uncharacterized protein LOC111037946 [Myzus persicae]